MKKVYVLVVLFFLVNLLALGQDPFNKSELKKISQAACSSIFNCNVRMDFDKHSNKIKIYQKKPLNYTGGSLTFGFYLTKSGDKLIKRKFLKVVYNGSNWRFIERIDLTLGFMKDGDENKMQNLSIHLSHVNRVVNSGGSVSETAYVTVNNDIERFFRERFEDERFLSVKVIGEDTYYTAGIFGKAPRKKIKDLFQLYDNEYNENFLNH